MNEETVFERHFLSVDVLFSKNEIIGDQRVPSSKQNQVSRDKIIRRKDVETHSRMGKNAPKLNKSYSSSDPEVVSYVFDKP